MQEPPLKRQKLDNGSESITDRAEDEAGTSTLKYIRECDVGITEFINRNNEGFDCLLKYR
jgi:hypothetical protein